MVATTRTRLADTMDRGDPRKAADFVSHIRYGTGISDAAPEGTHAPNMRTELGQILDKIKVRNEALRGIRDNLASLVQNLDGPDPDGAPQLSNLKPLILGVLPEIMDALECQDEVVKQIGQYSARLEQLA